VDNIHATWYEIHYYTEINYPDLSLDNIKNDIITDIDENTKNDIIHNFKWNGNPVWLSIENQNNFAAAEHIAATTGDNLPHKEKIGEDDNGEPIYYTFETTQELTDFVNAFQTYINNCRQRGWNLKDSINWDDYKTAN
jgi:hypothetical protein